MYTERFWAPQNVGGTPNKQTLASFKFSECVFVLSNVQSFFVRKFYVKTFF